MIIITGYIRSGICIIVIANLMACGGMGGADKGLFSEANNPTAISRPGEIVGIWELDNTFQSNTVSNTQYNGFNNANTGTQNLMNQNVSRTRIQFDSNQPSSIKVSTYCENKDFSSNKILLTYVNSAATVSLSENNNAVNGNSSSPRTISSGTLSIGTYSNQNVSGNKNFACPLAFSSVGFFNFQIQDGVMYLDIVSSNNQFGATGAINNQFGATSAMSNRISLRKVRD